MRILITVLTLAFGALFIFRWHQSEGKKVIILLEVITSIYILFPFLKALLIFFFIVPLEIINIIHHYFNTSILLVIMIFTYFSILF